MLEHKTRDEGRIVEFTLDGDIERSQFDALLASLEAGIARHGKIRVLEHVRSVGRVPPGAIWPDLMFGVHHIHDIDRAAVVSDRKWIGLFTKGAASLMPGDVRQFPEAELDQARSWLKGPSPGVHLERIYAHLGCRDLDVSSAWYEKLFGRPRDTSPMEGLHEWHHCGCAGLQLFRDPERAGQSTITLIGNHLESDHQMLVERGLDPGPIEEGGSARVVRLKDPDGNRVVLAQPSA